MTATNQNVLLGTVSNGLFQRRQQSSLHLLLALVPTSSATSSRTAWTQHTKRGLIYDGHSRRTLNENISYCFGGPHFRVAGESRLAMPSAG